MANQNLHVIAKVYDEVDGILKAASKSELPHNCHRVYNTQHSSTLGANTGKADSIFELIQD